MESYACPVINQQVLSALVFRFSAHLIEHFLQFGGQRRTEVHGSPRYRMHERQLGRVQEMSMSLIRCLR